MTLTLARKLRLSVVGAVLITLLSAGFVYTLVADGAQQAEKVSAIYFPSSLALADIETGQAEVQRDLAALLTARNLPDDERRAMVASLDEAFERRGARLSRPCRTAPTRPARSRRAGRPSRSGGRRPTRCARSSRSARRR
jgi:hypothetical protein